MDPCSHWMECNCLVSLLGDHLLALLPVVVPPVPPVLVVLTVSPRVVRFVTLFSAAPLIEVPTPPMADPAVLVVVCPLVPLVVILVCPVLLHA